MKYFIALSILLITFISCGKAPQSDQVEDLKKDSLAVDTVDEIPDTTLTDSILTTDIIPEKSDMEDLSTAQLWDKYNSAKQELAKSREQNDFEQTKNHLLEAAWCAARLGRQDIEVWQYNNIGFYAIEKFKEIISYDQKMSVISSMSPGKEKVKYYNSVIADFTSNINILTEAEEYLTKAQDLDLNLLDDNLRTMRIENNIRFIKDVKKMISD